MAAHPGALQGRGANPISVSAVSVVGKAAGWGFAPSDAAVSWLVRWARLPARSSRQCSGIVSVVGRECKWQMSTPSCSGRSLGPNALM